MSVIMNLAAFGGMIHFCECWTFFFCNDALGAYWLVILNRIDELNVGGAIRGFLS